MSTLDKYNKAQLLALADQLGGVTEDLNMQMPKAKIIAAIEEAGIGDEEAQQVFGADEKPEAPAPVDEEAKSEAKTESAPAKKNKILIKMVRENPRYDVGALSFTQEHPFAVVEEDLAEYLLTKEEGFRQASPAEAREFYG